MLSIAHACMKRTRDMLTVMMDSRAELVSFAYLWTYGVFFVSTHKYDKVRVSCRLYLSTVRHSIFDRAPCEDDVPREGAAHIILTSSWAMHTSRPLGMVLEERHHGVHSGATELAAPAGAETRAVPATGAGRSLKFLLVSLNPPSLFGAAARRPLHLQLEWG